MNYILSELAAQDLDDIWFYIAADSEAIADRVLKEIREAMRKLAERPGKGHIRDDLDDPEMRVWSVYSYLIIYRRNSNPLEIVRVIHGARDIPNIL